MSLHMPYRHPLKVHDICREPGIVRSQLLCLGARPRHRRKLESRSTPQAQIERVSDPALCHPPIIQAARRAISSAMIAFGIRRAIKTPDDVFCGRCAPAGYRFDLEQELSGLYIAAVLRAPRRHVGQQRRLRTDDLFKRVADAVPSLRSLDGRADSSDCLLQ